MLVWMTINHLSGPLHAYSFETLGFVSSAEGFVFISGIVSGMVYGRIGLTKGTSTLRWRAFRRALDVYLFHMVSFLMVLVLELTVSNDVYRIYYAATNRLPIVAPLTALGLGAVFFLQPPLLDILPMYCLYLLVTPFLLNRFKKKTGAWWVLGGSFFLWALAPFSAWDNLQRYSEHILPVNFGFFDPLAWQFLFVGGLIVGYRRYTGKTFPVKTLLITISLLVWGGNMLFRYKMIPSNLMGFEIHSLTIRETFGPLRVVNLAALAYLITCMAIRFPKLFKWPWLAYLGQHSLQVFTFHVLLLYSIIPLYNHLVIPAGWIWIIAADMVILGSLTIPARLHARYRAFRQNKGARLETRDE
jgi:hypothetical protein